MITFIIVLFTLLFALMSIHPLLVSDDLRDRYSPEQ